MMMSLIDDILDNAKIEKQALTLLKSNFGLAELIGEVISIFEIQANGKGVDLNFEFESHDYEIQTD